MTERIRNKPAFCYLGFIFQPTGAPQPSFLAFEREVCKCWLGGLPHGTCSHRSASDSACRLQQWGLKFAIQLLCTQDIWARCLRSFFLNVSRGASLFG